MGRENAVLLSKIYAIQKERGRGIYPEELASFQVCARSKCKEVIDRLLTDSMLIESSDNGANVYAVSNIGLAHMEAYLDIRREM